ncbi:MAG: hypothetical protein HY367_01135 [Candidatus Aenigmarchaeota archaeon]|nr:hypothetical protein [Candidatus Aenigmarchaeota archaeon]
MAAKETVRWKAFDRLGVRRRYSEVPHYAELMYGHSTNGHPFNYVAHVVNGKTKERQFFCGENIEGAYTAESRGIFRSKVKEKLLGEGYSVD